MLTLVILLIILGYWYVKHQRVMNYWQDRGVKHVRPLPIVGNWYPMLTKKTSHIEFMEDLHKQFPKERYSGIYQFTTPVLLVRDPDLLKQMLVRNFDSFVDHSDARRVDHDPMWARTLIALKGGRWKYMRGTLSPLFTGSKIRIMFGLIKECSEQLVGHFKDLSQEVIDVEMKDIAMRYSIDVITTCALGIKSDSIKFPENEFIKTAKELVNYTGINRFKFALFGYFPKLCALLRAKIVSKKAKQFFESLILGTVKTRHQQNIVRSDLIHLLIEARKGHLKYEEDLEHNTYVSESKSATATPTYISDDDMVAQSIIFVMGGFDTTSRALFACCYELAIQPHIQTRLREEIFATLDKYNGQFTYEGLTQMKYMDMVVSETLRKWPPVGWLDRQCIRQFDIEPQKPGEQPLTIEEGLDIFVSVVGFHQDPQYFPEPDLFDPERFNDENKSNIKPFTYMPFGEGPRHCIGFRFAVINFKSFMFSMLANFEVLPNENTMIPMKPSKESLALSVDGGCQLSLRRLPPKA